MRKFWKLFVALALVASLAVASAPVADAHTLGYGKAKVVAEDAELQFVLANETEFGYGTFSPPLASRRVSRHKWVFKFAFRFENYGTSLEGTNKVSVRYKNAHSRKVVWRVYAIHVN